MAKERKDEFSQIGYIQVVQSGANALTFTGITILTSFLANTAMLIHTISYEILASAFALMTTATDFIAVGLAGSDSLVSTALSDPEVYDSRTLIRNDFGTAASGSLWESPLMTDFTALPGGGVLVPADRIYGWVASSGLASAVSVKMRFRFTVIELTAQQYLELAQALRVLR